MEALESRLNGVDQLISHGTQVLVDVCAVLGSRLVRFAITLAGQRHHDDLRQLRNSEAVFEHTQTPRVKRYALVAAQLLHLGLDCFAKGCVRFARMESDQRTHKLQ